MENNDHFPVVYRVLLIVSMVSIVLYGPQTYRAIKNYVTAPQLASNDQEKKEDTAINTKSSRTTKTKKGKKSTSSPVEAPLDFGKALDSFNHVKIYYNGSIRNVLGRNITPDGYNLGLKYQCVEFVKRYYYEHFNHKMPVSNGHAKEYFDSGLSEGAFNKRRGLIQYANKGTVSPKVNDIIVFGADQKNIYGHIAIVSKVGSDYVELVQQNVGRQTRVVFPLIHNGSSWTIDRDEILGWLRMPG